jgi:hypothetical protein
MIPRHLKITFVLLLCALAATLLYTWLVKRGAHRAAVQAPAELQRPIAPPVSGAAEHVVLFIADDQGGVLHRADATFTLPPEPGPRLRELLRGLVSRYVAPDSTHALPAGADVNDVYIVNGNVALVDVNSAFADAHRSGVLAEELTVLSLVQTISANMPGIAQVKILVNGKERETLAGHAELADFYDVAAVNRAVSQMSR